MSTNSSVYVRAGAFSTVSNTAVQITIMSNTFAQVQSTMNIWTYITPGQITSISPAEGQFGSMITITGTNLRGGGTSVGSILMDGVPGTVTSETDTTIQVTLGDDSLRDSTQYPGQVFIQASTGAVVIGAPFQQRAPGRITSFSPLEGRMGTEITIVGNDLTGFGTTIMSVEIAGVSALPGPYSTTQSDTMLVVQAAFASTGTSGPIRLTINTGAIIESNQSFTYLQNGSITVLTPTSGAEGSGILIRGQYLRASATPITSVTIGGSEVSRIVTQSETEVAVIAGPAPNSSLSNLPVRLTAEDESYIERNLFTYQNLVLSITGTNQGQYGTRVTLSVPFPVNEIITATVDDQEAMILARNEVPMTISVEIPRARRTDQYTADITVESNNHTIARLRDGFTYLTEGHISSIDPVEGQMGTRVTIFGQNLYGGGASISSVTVGGIAAKPLGSSQTMINISISNNPSSMSSFPLTSSISVIANTGAITQRIDAFSYVQPGNILTISPSSGQRGTRVTINGTNLLQGSLQVSSVRLAGVLAQVTGTSSNTEIQVVASTSMPKNGSVEIILSSGAVINSTATAFQYNTAGSITSVTPNSGTVGTRVTIQGIGLLGGGASVSTVRLDGVMANVSSASDTSIIVVAQQAVNSLTPGRVEVVSNTGAIISVDATWSYSQLGSITSISPDIGQQGNMVTITGTSLLGSSGSSVTDVTLAGLPATVVSSTDTTVMVRAGYSSSAVAGPVQLIVDSGPVITSMPAQDWSYYNASFNSISPSSGTNGTLVTLSGINLPGLPDSTQTVDQVILAGIEATNIQAVSSSTITVRAGVSPQTGIESARVISSSGAYLELTNAWQYEEPGMVDSIQPSIAYPGDTVTITGQRLVSMGTTNVKVVIGQTEAFSAAVISPEQLKITPGPYHGLDLPNMPLPVLIEAGNGATVVSGFFTYNQTAGMVTGISPLAGGSGSRVTITGTGLLNGAPPVSVYLAGVQAMIVNTSDTEIVVETGIGSDISGSVVIQANNSRQIGRAGNAWTYLPAVTASMVSPQSGRNGTLVKIDLSAIPNEYMLQSVQLGNITATIVSTVNKVVTIAANISSTSTTVGSITLTFQNSTELTIANSWSYLSPTTITAGSSDMMGYYNSLITLSGTGFQGPSGVQVTTATLAGINTTIVSQSNTELKLRIAENLNSTAGNISGPIILVFDDGAVFDSQGVLFTYLQVNVVSVSPSSGQYRTRVTIQGTGLLAGGLSISAMNLSNVAVENVISQTNTEIIASAAAFNAANTAAGDIVYTLDTEAQVTIPASWSYVSPGEITSVDPVSGNRGTVVTIMGRNMLGGGAQANTVYLNSIPAEEVLISSDSLIQVKAGGGPMQSSGNVTIVADTEAELTSQTNLFAYREPGSVNSISPSTGQYGTKVNVSGLRFDDGEGIRIITVAGVQADIESSTSTSVIVTLQRPSQLGSFEGQVVIESNQGTITQSLQIFTYLQEGFIATLTPTQGQRGTRITLNGVDLRGGGSSVQSATIAGTPADIMSQTNTEVVLMAGENAASLSNQVMGDIVLTADTGAQVTRVSSWTYVRYGNISSVTPTIGQYGTRITLTGTDLTAGAQSVQQVSISSITAFSIDTSSPTQVVFRAGEPPSSNLTNGTITLISSDGGNITTEATWTYQTPGMITSVNPVNGTGSISVTVEGINLLGGGTNVTKVSVAGIEAREIQYSNVSNTFVTFTTGFNDNGAELTGDIVIEADTGALTIAENSWTYTSECPVGQFGNTNSCMPCDVECQQCRGPTEFDCFDCRNFRILNGTHTECVELCPTLSTTDKQCVESCQSNQFEETNLGNITFCQDCAQECDPNLGCTGSNNTISDCTRCRDVAHNGFCISECPIGTFNDRGTCTSCSSQCELMLGCSGPSAADCNQCSNVTLPAGSANTSAQDICVESCPRNFYVDTNKVCRPCNPECRDSCTGPMASQCTACSGASLRYSNGSQICVPECNPNTSFRSFFQDDTTGVCQQCSPLCSLDAGCTGPSAASCTAACRNFTGNNQDESEFLPRYRGECVLQCPDNPNNNTYFYADLRTGICMPCSSQCTNDCTGPQPSNCIGFSPQQHAFSAGPGTITLVIITILILFAALVAVSAILVWKLFFNNRDNYIPRHITNVEGGIVLEQHEQSTRIDIPEVDTSDVLWSSTEESVKPKRVQPPDEYILMQSPVKRAFPYEIPILKEKEKTELEETYAEMDSPPPEENYTEMEIQTPPSSPFPEPESSDSETGQQQSPVLDPGLEDLPVEAMLLDPTPPRPPKPTTTQEAAAEKPLPPVPPPKPSSDEDNDDVFSNPTAGSDTEEPESAQELPEKLEGGVPLSQENIYDDTEVVPNRYADLPMATARSISPSSDISDPLPPPPAIPGQDDDEENLYDDTCMEPSSPTKDTEPLVSHIDDVYEDTDDATMAAKEYLKRNASPPLPEKPQNPPLPPRQTIPKRLSNTPLPALPTMSSSVPATSPASDSQARPLSITSLPEEEQLYEPIPASANLIEEPKSKKPQAKPQAKPRGLKGKLSFGRK